ncbi:uncharacterized protein LODBEIA_P40260 [Lodderomyces beijingensis]|uniref:Uncharacterized protein n=1 Tax=Lodderomyces beijingensis TaxID=1775926 RepID=A0ABP0ZR35_9ASCO
MTTTTTASNSSNRPKRKAATNKSYYDSADVLSEDYSAYLSSNSSSSSLSSTPLPREPKTKKPKIRASAASSAKENNGTSSKKNDARAIPASQMNWQPAPKPEDYFSNRLNLADAYIDLKEHVLYCPHHVVQHPSNSGNKRQKEQVFTLRKDQCIYMVSEPAGDPYFIGRIKGFAKRKNEQFEQVPNSAQDERFVSAQGYEFSIQWFFRPRDVTRTSSDSRLLYATMHSDTCPLHSFRGTVTVELKQDIEDAHATRRESEKPRLKKSHQQQIKSESPSSAELAALDAYTREPNRFYFDRLYDRFLIRYYDVLSTNNLLQYAQNEENTSRNFLTALNKRFKYIFCEPQKTKALVNSLKANTCNCAICGLWCDTADSVNCAECQSYFHMTCLDPPLLKKPSRGFSWSCAACAKKQEIEYHRKKIPMLSHDNKSSNQMKLTEELSELHSTGANESSQEDASLEGMIANANVLPNYELKAIEFLENDADKTIEERRNEEEWCMRYLGLNAKLEEVVDLDEKVPYPRASTRIGARHQVVYIPECNGHPIVYYDIEKSSMKKKSSPTKSKPKVKIEESDKLSIPEEFIGVEPDQYPSWLQPRPKGYVERGVDDGNGQTCALLWKSPRFDLQNDFIELDAFVESCAPVAKSLGLSPNSPNFIDAVLASYLKHNGDRALAYDEVSHLTKKKLHEPVFTKEEIRRFEAGVKEFGSELHHVQQKVKTQPIGQIVRFYYLWKKTPNGRNIWGNFEGRSHKKVQNVVKEDPTKDSKHPTILDELADPNDDSSYEGSKIDMSQAEFSCKHCSTTESLQWFRIAGHDAKQLESNPVVLALCFRCARLWRRYGVVWENPNDVLRGASKSSGSKKRVEWELLQDAHAILDKMHSYNEMDVHFEKEKSKSSPSLTDSPRPESKASSRRKTATAATNAAAASPSSTTSLSSSSNSTTTTTLAMSKAGDRLGGKIPVAKPAAVAAPNIPSPKARIDEVIAKELGEKVKKMLFNFKYEAPALKYDDDQQSFQSRVEAFRNYQLSNAEAVLQVPNETTIAGIEVPFSPHERKCCMCREHDTNKTSLQEMLICACCGVNVHASCAGYHLPEKLSKPVKEWLCEPCVNDLKPVNSAIYTCCLCLAHETNFELAIFGSHQVRPDFLKSTSEGNWCHLLCALFSRVSTVFQKAYGNLKYSSIAIGDVAKVFLRNHQKKCSICNTANGALVECELCLENHFYHPTCAQDTPNYKLGFSIIPRTRAANTVIVNGKSGELKPILVCPKHDQSEDTILNLRTLGTRANSRGDTESKPLVQLYLEETVKQNHKSKCTSGPRARSREYIENRSFFFNRSDTSCENGTSKAGSEPSSTSCSVCATTTSPIWWPGSLCQSCHHHSQDEVVADNHEQSSTSLRAVLETPIDGSNYGIKNPQDSLKNVYKPNILTEAMISTPPELVRSKISLGDILD